MFLCARLWLWLCFGIFVSLYHIQCDRSFLVTTLHGKNSGYISTETWSPLSSICTVVRIWSVCSHLEKLNFSSCGGGGLISSPLLSPGGWICLLVLLHVSLWRFTVLSSSELMRVVWTCVLIPMQVVLCLVSAVLQWVWLAMCVLLLSCNQLYCEREGQCEVMKYFVILLLSCHWNTGPSTNSLKEEGFILTDRL